MFAENLRLALDSIAANRLRAVLTVVGVMVGVFSVTLIIALGQAVGRQVSGSLDALGSNTVFLYPEADVAMSSPSVVLTERDAATVALRVQDVLRTASLLTGQGRAGYGTLTVDAVMRGVDDGYFDLVRLSILEGRSFSASDVSLRTNGVVIGSSVAEQLFGGQSAVGSRIRLNGVSTTVVGVAAMTGGGSLSDPNDFILVPISTARQRFGMGGGAGRQAVNMILVEFPPGVDLSDAQAEIARVLVETKRIRPDIPPPFGTSSTAELAQTTSSVIGVVQAVLSAIASISIFVGGIGITNIMLVTVSERTREIGIRMAVGARRQDIRGQFLTESALLCTCGGTFGVLLAVGTTLLIRAASGFDVFIELSHVALAFVISILIGVVAGFVPARKAALLDPIEALRRE
ncbi:MAG: ABC transporter permease [Brevundimonas sp.]|jgi:putative ABC transport system permease protein|nr:ABC transporter permease [Brevundimonas sp.]